MNKKDAMEWVNALRSGKYRQGYHFLQKNKKFCCLGVLNKIMPEKYSKNRLGEYINATINFKSIDGYIPSLDTPLARLNDGIYINNDFIKLNFNEIADIIQIFYKEL